MTMATVKALRALRRSANAAMSGMTITFTPAASGRIQPIDDDTVSIGAELRASEMAQRIGCGGAVAGHEASQPTQVSRPT